jgi:hypothetical protein
VHSPNGGTPKGDCENQESAIVEVGLQVLFRPKGASTNQPRAERSAALGLNCRTDSSPERAIQEFSQLLFRPFRAREATWGGAPVGRSAPGCFVSPFQGEGGSQCHHRVVATVLDRSRQYGTPPSPTGTIE